MRNVGYSVHPQATVLEALRKLAEHDIGALLVMEGERLLGIFSERDYARKLVLLGRFSKGTRVEEVMTREVITVTPETTLQEAMRLMTEHRVRHLPVLEEGRVVGVVSIGDAVKAIITEQEVLIEELSRYVMENR
ncbi:CBS domain-containing protein [Thermus scotoductus]|uniref:CBS domain-containing protein n=1 Tax=Thermus scotoductus TaxID=37636 RepID=UPI000362C00C|nr:CBS domain-containing protein [Thermus scotoductus]